jgi:hypothetical protein
MARDVHIALRTLAVAGTDKVGFGCSFETDTAENFWEDLDLIVWLASHG